MPVICRHAHKCGNCKRCEEYLVRWNHAGHTAIDGYFVGRLAGDEDIMKEAFAFEMQRQGHVRIIRGIE